MKENENKSKLQKKVPKLRIDTNYGIIAISMEKWA